MKHVRRFAARGPETNCNFLAHLAVEQNGQSPFCVGG
jgi:hypothetical protein